MNILFLEAYYGGSHQAFADGWKTRSAHAITLETLPARKWKWRMQTSAWIFAERMAAWKGPVPDVIFATDMLNLAELRALEPPVWRPIPHVLYFHENQYSYPEQVDGRAFYHWGVINATSALAADCIVFNSPFHREDFFARWRQGNRVMPDGALPEGRIDALQQAAEVIPVGLDFDFLDQAQPATPPAKGAPVILWNHRWEHDKNPESFFQTLCDLQDEGADFRVAVCGERFANEPAVFAEARRTLQDRIVHWGFFAERQDYARCLWESDIVLSTSIQEFLGLSVIEAAWCGCYPLLPARLNYPHLLPEPWKGACLYDNNGDLKKRLRGVLEAETKFPARADFLRPYGWREVSERLDFLIENL